MYLSLIGKPQEPSTTGMVQNVQIKHMEVRLHQIAGHILMSHGCTLNVFQSHVANFIYFLSTKLCFT